MSQRLPCPYCGNTQFEEENGIVICTSCGRQQEGGLQVVDDDADFGTQGKVTRKKVEKTKVKVSKVYRGARGYRLYLLAWEHVLWRQCHALIHGEERMPEELWTVVKDLWSLKLARLEHRLDSKGTSSTDVKTDDTIGDASSDAGGETASSSEKTGRLQPKLWDTVALAYFGTLLLRHSISLSTLYQLIRTEEVSFIRAIRHVPSDITSKLPSEHQLALDTTTIPTQQELQKAVYKLLQEYNQDFGIALPALNWKVLLFEWIQELGLPLEIYAAVKRLAQLVEYDFTYELLAGDKSQGGGARKKRRSPVATPEVQLVSLIVVATKLLYPFALPHPQTSQHTVSSTGSYLDWQSWLNIHSLYHKDKRSELKPDQAIQISAHDIHGFDLESLDQYMDWYQGTFTTPASVLREKKTDLENNILNMFPLQNISQANNQGPHQTSIDESKSTADFVSQIQREAIRPTPTPTLIQPQPPTPTNDSDDEHPAASPPSTPHYPIFLNLHTLHLTTTFFTSDASKNPIISFHERAAELACLDLKRLLRAVRYTEKRLEAWHDRQRRSEVLPPVGEGGGTSGDSSREVGDEGMKVALELGS